MCTADANPTESNIHYDFVGVVLHNRLKTMRVTNFAVGFLNTNTVK